MSISICQNGVERKEVDCCAELSLELESDCTAHRTGVVDCDVGGLTLPCVMHPDPTAFSVPPCHFT